jgi:hypothetical protein
MAYGCVLLLLAIVLAGAGHGSYAPIMAFGARLSLIQSGDPSYLFAFVSVPPVWSLIALLAVTLRCGRGHVGSRPSRSTPLPRPRRYGGARQREDPRYRASREGRVCMRPERDARCRGTDRCDRVHKNSQEAGCPRNQPPWDLDLGSWSLELSWSAPSAPSPSPRRCTSPRRRGRPSTTDARARC